MRAYKLLFIGSIITYIFCLGIHSFFLLQPAFSEKSSVIHQLNTTSNAGPRVIIFGSSSCYYGIRAHAITQATQIPTFNLCYPGFDTLENFKTLLNSLSSQDLVVYTIRLKFKEDKPYKFLSLNLPNFFDFFIPQAIAFYRRFSSTSDTPDGDITNYKLERMFFAYPSYDLLPNKVQENLKKQLSEISEVVSKFKSHPQILVVTAPLLMEVPNPQLSHLSLNAPLPSQLVDWIPPLVITDIGQFADAYHANELGRETWTQYLIPYIKSFLNKERNSNYEFAQ